MGPAADEALNPFAMVGPDPPGGRHRRSTAARFVEEIPVPPVSSPEHAVVSEPVSVVELVSVTGNTWLSVIGMDGDRVSLMGQVTLDEANALLAFWINLKTESLVKL